MEVVYRYIRLKFLYTPPKAIFFIEGCYFFMLFVIIILGGIIMWKIEKGNIYVTRGDMLPLAIDALNADKSQYKFKIGEIIRIKVMEAGNVKNVLLQN